MKKTLPAFAAALLLAACAGTGTPSYTAPPMSGTWKDIGFTKGNNIVVGYETGSIRKNGDIARLRDRKIVINPALEQYQDTPRYKIAVSDWEFHCKNRSYRLAGVQFLDERGVMIGQEHFSPTQIRPMPLNGNSIAQRQFDIACR
ncbi:MAG: hypothetical protein Q4E77_01585 [Conchiformibius sp.]|nr:hypothetical protein [Conchiformibius sp.]